MTDDLLKLAERVEKASGPDRELDCDIGRALGYVVTYEEDRRRFYGKGQLDDIERLAKRTMPKWTASLDAALTLVPEGCGIELTRYWGTKDDAPRWSCSLSWGLRNERARVDDLKSPALALCAAALRNPNNQRGSNHDR